MYAWAVSPSTRTAATSMVMPLSVQASCTGWKNWATAGAIRYKTAYPVSDQTARAGVASSTAATAAAAARRRRGRRCRSGWERVLRIRSGDGPTGSFIRR